MKKGLIVGACFLFIIIALVSVVSAGFFSNMWGKITGQATTGSCSGEIDYYDAEEYCYFLSSSECKALGDPCYWEDECVYNGGSCTSIRDSEACEDIGCSWTPDSDSSGFDTSGFDKPAAQINNCGDCIAAGKYWCKNSDVGSDCYEYGDRDLCDDYYGERIYYPNDDCSGCGKYLEAGDDLCVEPTILKSANDYDNCPSCTGAEFVWCEDTEGGGDFCADSRSQCTSYDGERMFSSGDDCSGCGEYLWGAGDTCVESTTPKSSTDYATCPTCIAASTAYYWCYADSKCGDLNGESVFTFCSDTRAALIDHNSGTCPVCGDGKIDPGEYCDDGNTVNEDECSNTCVVNPNVVCIETDAGFDPYTRSTTRPPGLNMQDQCDSNTGKLFEFFCSNSITADSDELIESVSVYSGVNGAVVICPRGCELGECKGDACGDRVCSTALGETKLNCGIDCGGNEHEQYKTCQDCVGDSGFTWCDDAGNKKCLSDPISCNSKINFDNECPTTTTTTPIDCKPCQAAGEVWCDVDTSIGADRCVDSIGYCNEVLGSVVETCPTTTLIECKSNLNSFSSYSTKSDVSKIIRGASYLKEQCDASFTFNRLYAFPQGYSALPNERVIAILEITSTESGALFNFTLNETEINSPSNITFYISDALNKKWIELTTRDIPIRNEQEKAYIYPVYLDHFSFLVITEPNYCGNGVFDSTYETCDGSVTGVTNCISDCTACETDFEVDGSGNCVDDIEGTECSDKGDEECVGYNLYECDNDLEWDKKGIVLDECEVECLKGSNSCRGEYPLSCGTDYQWDLQTRINGMCGYTSTQTLGYDGTTTSEDELKYCGNGYCGYNEDESNCPEDCEEGKISKNWMLPFIIIVISFLILLIVFVLFKIYKKEKRRPQDPNRRLPPEHRPGPKRPMGRPPVIRHGQMGRPPARKVSPGGYAVRRYPARPGQ